MKKLLLLCVCLLAVCSSPMMAQTGEPQVIVVQVYYTGLGVGHLTVTRGEGQTEAIEFKQTNPKQTTQAETCQRVFNKLYQEGYSLKSTFSPGAGTISTLIFAKGQ
jgi:hypothetical protein